MCPTGKTDHTVNWKSMKEETTQEGNQTEMEDITMRNQTLMD